MLQRPHTILCFFVFFFFSFAPQMQLSRCRFSPFLSLIRSACQREHWPRPFCHFVRFYVLCVWHLCCNDLFIFKCLMQRGADSIISTRHPKHVMLMLHLRYMMQRRLIWKTSSRWSSLHFFNYWNGKIFFSESETRFTYLRFLAETLVDFLSESPTNGPPARHNNQKVAHELKLATNEGADNMTSHGKRFRTCFVYLFSFVHICTCSQFSWHVLFIRS